MNHELQDRFDYLPGAIDRPEELRVVERLKTLGFSDDLAMTFFEATKERYIQHILACQSVRQKPERFGVFAREVVDCPNDAVRISILKQEPLPEAYEAFRSFDQYLSPREA